MWDDFQNAIGVSVFVKWRFLLPFTTVVCGLCVSATSAFGQNWTLTTAPTEAWSAVAGSADLTIIAAVINGGGIYTFNKLGHKLEHEQRSKQLMDIHCLFNQRLPNGCRWSQRDLCFDKLRRKLDCNHWNWVFRGVIFGWIETFLLLSAGGIYASTNFGATWTSRVLLQVLFGSPSRCPVTEPDWWHQPNLEFTHPPTLEAHG